MAISISRRCIVAKEKDFDFTGAKEIPEEEDEIATSGSPEEEEPKKLSKEEQEEEVRDAEVAVFKPKKRLTKKRLTHLKNKGQETPEIIAEARKLAESRTGLDVEKFFKKHGLVNINLDRLLHHPLSKETGYYA